MRYITIYDFFNNEKPITSIDEFKKCNYGKFILKNFKPKEDPAYVYRVKNSRIVDSEYLISGNIKKVCMYLRVGNKFRITNNHPNLTFAKPKKTITAPVFYIYNYFLCNYYHTMYDGSGLIYSYRLMKKYIPDLKLLLYKYRFNKRHLPQTSFFYEMLLL